MSMITQGIVYSFIAATAPAARSAPSWAGLSILMLRPVLTPGPSTKGTMLKSFEMAEDRAVVTLGTTEQITASSMSKVLTPFNARTSLTEMAYWSPVSFVSVARRAVHLRVSSSKTPRVMLVFPTSAVRSIVISLQIKLIVHYFIILS